MSRFPSEDQQTAVAAAIAAAERGNSGEVRLHIDTFRVRHDALIRAQQLYLKLGMDHTIDDTGVLLYVCLQRRDTAVVAGSGVVKHVSDDVWQEVSDAMAAGFRDGRPLEGLTDALAKVGAILRETLPSEDRAGNELPDQVTRDDIETDESIEPAPEQERSPTAAD